VADDGLPASYARIGSQLAVLGAPVVAVPGNHDDPQALAGAFGHQPAAVRVVDVGTWRIVAVTTAVQHQDHGSLEPLALDALEEALATSPGPVLIGLHHPPIAVCADAACRLAQAAEVLAMIRRHPNVRGVASGHLHLTEELERDGVAFLLSPSTCLQLRHEHPLPEHNRDATPVGARVLDLADDGTLRSHVIWAAVG
jgi:Icc protein